jgi:hypothetical protein
MVEEDEVLGTPAPNPSSLTWNHFADFDLFAVRNLTMTPHPYANQEWNEQLTALKCPDQHTWECNESLYHTSCIACLLLLLVHGLQ